MADLYLTKDVFPALFTILDNDPFIASQYLHLPPIYPFSSFILDEVYLEDSISDLPIELPVFNFFPSLLHCRIPHTFSIKR